VFYNGTMPVPILTTKLYIPSPRPQAVIRSRLIQQLNEGLQRKLTLISAPAGFGKTTLISEWIVVCGRPVAWVSLDEGDKDLSRFLTYLVAALRTIDASLEKGMINLLESQQPPPTRTILTTLLNRITTLKGSFALVLDDYHLVSAKLVDEAVTFLIDHLPPQMHLVIVSREDPQLPVARLRAQDQLTELRAADLRFSVWETGEFLNRVMGLALSDNEINALEARTEGWIAGLQLAAISMQGHQAPTSFIKSFTGSNNFVLDYLVQEVLNRQPEDIQTFLLRTSILDRMCGPLCDAVLQNKAGSGEDTLAYLERINLFMIPLDNERRWYRYHHLFADLLRQRLHQRRASSVGGVDANELHVRASVWYEDNGLQIAAFHHAAAANDIERAERLIEEQEMPLHFRGAVTVILGWLETLPKTVLDARPSLWWRFASLMLVVGQTAGVEEKLAAAEAALQGMEMDEKIRNLVGQIAAARAILALPRYHVDVLIRESRRALEYLAPDNFFSLTSAYWTLGFGYLSQGDRIAARQALTEAISLSQVSGSIFFTILATIGLGQIQEAENQLYLAAETYRRVLQMAGDQPLQIIYEAHLGLARVFYEWNDLAAAEQHGRQSLELARQYDQAIDRFVICEVFLARLKIAQGDIDTAAAMLSQTAQLTRQQNFTHRIPEVTAAQVLMLLHQGDVASASRLVQTLKLPLIQVRVLLAQGDVAEALTVLESLHQQATSKGWADEQLKVMVLRAIAYHMQGKKRQAELMLNDVLPQAESGGFIRLFIDEGPPMKRLLQEVVLSGTASDYAQRLLAAFPRFDTSQLTQLTLMDRLSEREIQVMRYLAEGMTNQEIADRLYLSLYTVKAHARNIYSKLGVNNRTLAVARARDLGILP
jgi:LuxR family maltose regulon positive regulatory protein